MIYIIAFFVPPLALLLNGQIFAAIFNVMLIVPCLFFGLIFHVLLAVPSAHAIIAIYHAREKPQASRDRRGDPRARPAAGVSRLTAKVTASVVPAASSALLITAPISMRGGAEPAEAGFFRFGRQHFAMQHFAFEKPRLDGVCRNADGHQRSGRRAMPPAR